MKHKVNDIKASLKRNIYNYNFNKSNYRKNIYYKVYSEINET